MNWKTKIYTRLSFALIAIILLIGLLCNLFNGLLISACKRGIVEAKEDMLISYLSNREPLGNDLQWPSSTNEVNVYDYAESYGQIYTSYDTSNMPDSFKYFDGEKTIKYIPEPNDYNEIVIECECGNIIKVCGLDISYKIEKTIMNPLEND